MIDSRSQLASWPDTFSSGLWQESKKGSSTNRKRPAESPSELPTSKKARSSPAKGMRCSADTSWLHASMLSIMPDWLMQVQSIYCNKHNDRQLKQYHKLLSAC